jgi:hypothetical protein
MNKAIDGKGHFVFTVSGLVAGDVGIVDKYNVCDAKEIARVCQTLSNSGFARCSRKGWWTIEHPILGLVQWKAGHDFRTAGEYFILRVNGKPVLNCWPLVGTYAKWESEAAEALSEHERELVERFLGTLQKGTNVPPELREQVA